MAATWFLPTELRRTRESKSLSCNSATERFAFLENLSFSANEKDTKRCPFFVGGARFERERRRRERDVRDRSQCEVEGALRSGSNLVFAD